MSGEPPAPGGPASRESPGGRERELPLAGRSHLGNQLVLAERAEIARGIRALLATPLLTARTSPEDFDLVRRRKVALIRWFDYYCGWPLAVEPRLGYARLSKRRRSDDHTRPARRLRTGRAPFDRRRYTLLCVAAAELLNVPVTTIGLLADRITRATAVDPVLDTFDTASRAERMAFVDALRLLERYGAVETVDGATESFVSAAEAKVLYKVDPALLMRLLSSPVGMSQLAVPAHEIPSRFDELLSRITRERRYGPAGEDDAVPVSDVQRNLRLRHGLFRRLVDDPVVHLEDLTEAERGYLASPTGRRLLRRAAEEAGLHLEERADGILLVDPERLSTDRTFPDDANSASVAALLLLDTVTASPAPPTREHLIARTEDVLRGNPRWARAHQDEGGARRLTAAALDVLTSFDLVTVVGGIVRPRPVAHRYRVTGTRTTAPQEAGAP